jgi:hypothetical protein
MEANTSPAAEFTHPVVWVGRFEAGLDPWKEVVLRPELTRNRYRVTVDQGLPALQVESEASASLMARPLNVDLNVTPILCWRWKVNRVIEQADMARRDADDYAARVYISFGLPTSALSFGVRAQLAIGRTIWGSALPDAAISYVWDNRHPSETIRPNVYTDRVMMVVMRSGGEQAGQWVQERRNVLRDVSRLFHPAAKAVQIAIAADTDNTRSSVVTSFSGLHFVAADAPCR